MQQQVPFKVVITECGLGPENIEREELDGIASVEVVQCKTEAQVIEAARDADAIMVQYAPISRVVIDETALVQVLRDGHIAGVGLDVMESEPIVPEHPLLVLGNVIFTPHGAFYSERSIELLKRQTARGVARILKGEASAAGEIFAVVNP